ncbi:MAG: TrpB-like pyridoxal phosphate-dependent enzyme [Actinobacteria bacterium]|nr:TrpB-like pyridoxal phosphate-dependent enzyme [Actinomycetota bacterium]
MGTTKFLLSEKEIPTAWYNVLADLPYPLEPYLHPVTREPVGPKDLSPLFPMELIKQEVSNERWIEIPDEVLEIYKLYRPGPLFRARRLEKVLDTPAKIYYKYEGGNATGSHKPNTAIAQAYYNKQEGIKRLTTETGAGQWGSALAMASSFFDIECVVYMVKVSYDQKPYRRSLMEVYGATVHASPTTSTQAGRGILKIDPDSPGSLGIAISEAVEDAAMRDDTHYSLGSVLNHVLLHQTIVGLETKKQMEMAGDYPDIMIGCCGGGSNFGGFSLPFIQDKFTGKDIRLVAVEPRACPTLTEGEYRYDLCDAAGMTPFAKMYTLGHDFVPAGIHAGGLRYHGDSPIISLLYDKGIIEAVAYHQTSVFDAAVQFARAEGIIPAPESAHAIRSAIDEALKAKEAGKGEVILFGLSGNGYFDMTAYDSYLKEKLTDYDFALACSDDK